MSKKLTEFNQYQQERNLLPIQIGIGIDGGVLMLGTVGLEERMEQTVYADAVNVASRLEGMTKMYGTSLLITEKIYHQLKNPQNYTIRLMDTVKVKGREEPLTVYQVFDGEDPNKFKLYKDTLETFSKGVALFREKNFAQAEKTFKHVLSINNDDVAAQIYLERCEDFQKRGVSEDWIFVRTLTTK